MFTPHAPTGIVSTPHRKPSTTLAGRQRIWTLLMREGAPLVWLPRTCDVAMTHFSHAESVAEICASPDFAAHCAAHPYPYADLTISGKLALDAFVDPTRRLFQRYITTQFRLLSGCTDFPHDQARRDARELLEDTFHKLLSRYEVWGANADGVIVSWGWEAFLAERLVRSVASKLRAVGYRVHEDIAGDAGRGLADEPTDPVRRADWTAIRDVVRRVLTEEIVTPMAEEAYRALVFRSGSYEEVAAELRCSTGSVGNRVSVPLIARLQEVLREEGFCGRGKVSFRRLRGPLAQAVPEADFDLLMAKRLPLPSGASKSEASHDDRAHAER
jgi:DNA-directed RNA polymerase specialized sigma24 family protein